MALVDAATLCRAVLAVACLPGPERVEEACCD